MHTKCTMPSRPARNKFDFCLCVARPEANFCTNEVRPAQLVIWASKRPVILVGPDVHLTNHAVTVYNNRAFFRLMKNRISRLQLDFVGFFANDTAYWSAHQKKNQHPHAKAHSLCVFYRSKPVHATMPKIRQPRKAYIQHSLAKSRAKTQDTWASQSPSPSPQANVCAGEVSPHSSFLGAFEGLFSKFIHRHRLECLEKILDFFYFQSLNYYSKESRDIFMRSRFF